MKKYILLVLMLCMGTHLVFSQKSKNIASAVKSATVFLNKAQVERTVQVSLQEGITILNFEKLSPFIDAKSIQIKANSSVSILSVNHKKNYLNKTQKSTKVKALENKIIDLESQIKLAKTEADIVAQSIDFLQQNKAIGGTNQTLTVTNLKQTADYYASQYKKLKLEELNISNKRFKLQYEIDQIEKEIRTISNTKDYPTGEIFVKVATKKSISATFDISYLVGNVSWYPTYDIKATNINEPLQIVYKANLQQNSQVDWNDISVSFSSDNPKTSGVAPELIPYKLSFNQVRNNKTEKVNYVEGTIFSEFDNQPLPGATIQAIGSNISTISDFDGKYSLSIPNNANSLKAEYIGFKSKIKNINSETLNFKLQEDISSLEEVIVVGYGTKKRNKNRTGAVSSINSNSLQIRGASSINNNAMPLTIVDGVPVDADYLESLNPDEIASTEVLKDASAASIYGSRASNGIILITTKNGIGANTTLTQTAVNFNLKKKRTIKSDVKSNEIQLTTLYVPAVYQYYTVPKVDKSAYLVAKIKDWEQYQLLDGETNVFFDNTFKSKGILDLSSVEDEIVISLGVDKQINISRSPISENNNKKFLSKNVETLKHWKIDIKNNKNQEINIQVLDQVPVSITDAIKVEILNTSNAEMNPKSGELKWNITIPKQTSTSFDVEYLVTHPKNKRLIIE